MQFHCKPCIAGVLYFDCPASITLSGHPNCRRPDKVIDAGHKATVKRSEQVWIDKINELKDKLDNRTFREKWSFGNLKAFDFAQHLYQPLICFKNNEVLKITPVSLNTGEKEFVDDLKAYYEHPRPASMGKSCFC